MRAVLDASVALKIALPEPDSPQARALIADSIAGIHELIAPDTFPAEIVNGLTRAERRGIIPDADVAISDVMANAPVLHPYMPFIGRAVEISRRLRVSSGDCFYVALAEQEGCEFITADQRLINALQLTFAS